ncbi:hypothetical protein C8J56DRAFT_900267 [Mycena floridula]|nr:hypothetical protein C8J56DRAFT_900267 [Mycena floridula]
MVKDAPTRELCGSSQITAQKKKNSLLVPKNVQSSHGAQKVVDTLFKFSSEISPRELFEEECKKEISARALWLADTVSNSPGQYQTAVAELREKEDEAEWAARASIFRDMAVKVGDLELMLFYGFQKENDDVETGIHQTSHWLCPVGDILDVGVKNQYEMGWTVFVDGVLPHSVIKILTNGARKPLFPTLNMDITPPEFVRAVLSTFLDSVWTMFPVSRVQLLSLILSFQLLHGSQMVSVCRSHGRKFMHPEDFYDLEIFKLPVSL